MAWLVLVSDFSSTWVDFFASLFIIKMKIRNNTINSCCANDCTAWNAKWVSILHTILWPPLSISNGNIFTCKEKNYCKKIPPSSIKNYSPFSAFQLLVFFHVTKIHAAHWIIEATNLMNTNNKTSTEQFTINHAQLFRVFQIGILFVWIFFVFRI